VRTFSSARVVAALALLDEKVRQVEKIGGRRDSYYREGDQVKEVLRLTEELGGVR